MAGIIPKSDLSSEKEWSERDRARAERERPGEVTHRRAGYGNAPSSTSRRFVEEMDYGLQHGMWSPPVEVREHGGNLEVIAELPGLAKEDVKVECIDEGIVIEGEKRQEREFNEGGYHRTERSYGHFYRMIPLPSGADPENAKAEFRDGILRVRIPFAEGRRPHRQIPIGA